MANFAIYLYVDSYFGGHKNKHKESKFYDVPTVRFIKFCTLKSYSQFDGIIVEPS